MLTPEDIEQNWQKFYGLCTKLGDRTPSVTAMLDDLDERLCLCPASAKRDFHGAFPGGLVDHSLRVLNGLVALNKAHDWKLPKESMIIGALFHDIGKVGLPGKDASNDFYLPQTDNWRRDKLGEEYKYNDEVDYLTTPDRSVFVLQHYGIRLNAEEWLAVKLNDGFVLQENKPYCLKISPLVYGVMTADYIATMSEKGTRFWPQAE
jgi:hypothetical protein